MTPFYGLLAKQNCDFFQLTEKTIFGYTMVLPVKTSCFCLSI